ncbi:MAG: hypothetical protein IH941_01350 [Acidobacteria bacterium]|nr:hypothetical protein [Acidobacteriota bacterium]
MTARLLKNGFISFEQAELAGKPDGTPSPPRLAEILGYFGAVALFVATIALTIEVAISDDFLFGSIDNIPGGFVVLVGAVLLFAIGYRLTGHDEGATKRSGGLTLAAGFGLWAIATNLLLLELDAADFTPLLIVVPIAAAAWWTYQRHQSVPTQLVLFFAAVQILNAALVLIQVNEWVSPQDQVIRIAVSGGAPEFEWLALVFGAALGVAWVWFTNEARLRPRNTGFAIGALYAGFQGLGLFQTDDGWIILFAAITGFVVYSGITWRSSVLLGIGTAGLIIFVVMLISILVDEVTAVSVALWFGIPGLAAVGYSLFGMQQLETDAVTEE